MIRTLSFLTMLLALAGTAGPIGVVTAQLYRSDLDRRPNAFCYDFQPPSYAQAAYVTLLEPLGYSVFAQGMGYKTAAIASASVETGIVTGRGSGCYLTACRGIESSVSLNGFGNLTAYREIHDVAGGSIVVESGVGVGAASLGMMGIVNEQGRHVGLGGGVSVGGDLSPPIVGAGAACHTVVIQPNQRISLLGEQRAYAEEQARLLFERVTELAGPTEARTYSVRIDCAHSDIASEGTSSRVTVQLLNAVRQPVHSSDADLTNAACESGWVTALPTWHLQSRNPNSIPIFILITIGGDNALFIDRMELYVDGEELRQWGRNEGRGWCMSTDPSDAGGNWQAVATGCSRALEFNMASREVTPR